MLELLRDGLWQSIGVLVAIVAALISIIIYRRQTQFKEFNYDIKSYPLLTEIEELEGRLQVQVDSVTVKNIDLMFLTFVNSGNAPIQRSDFDRPVTVAFDPPAKIFSVVVESEKPEGIGATLTVQQDTVTLNPLLLNPGDRVVLKLLLSSDTNAYEVSGRIVGVKTIGEVKPGNMYLWLVIIGSLMFTIGLAIFTYYMGIVKTSKLSSAPIEAWFVLAISFLGNVMVVFAIIRGNLIRKISRRL